MRLFQLLDSCKHGENQASGLEERASLVNSLLRASSYKDRKGSPDGKPARNRKGKDVHHLVSDRYEYL